MKKTTKGAIAAGAAAILLAGGAGTMAAWNASTNSSAGGTVQAGSMSIVEKSAATGWEWVGGDKDGDTYNPATDLLVPGDQVSYTATYEVELVGTNLKAQLVPELGGVSGDLDEFLDVSPADDSAQEITTSGDVEFTTVVTFRDLDEQGVYGAGEKASLAGGTITLEQVLNSR